MILYNTLMGVSAGLALILVPLFAKRLVRKEMPVPEGWSITFGILGAILTFLSGAMATTWPLTANPPINIMFAEPSLVLGVTLLAASFFTWKRRDLLVAVGSGTKVGDEAYEELRRVLSPVKWLLFGLGLILFACTCAILRFGFVGGAPELEPISGLLHNHPAVENTFFGIMYGLAALGTLLAPWALRNLRSPAARAAGVFLVSAGVCFLLFSVMNYYTHIGLLVNLQQGTHYRF